MSFDQIADMLARIRNAQLAGRMDVSMPSSKFKLALAQVLYNKGYIEKASIFSEGNKSFLKIKLKYDKGQPLIKGLKKVSKQGCRIYKGKDDIRNVKNGYGFAVISTSKGLLTDREARKEGIGGEIVCEIW
ncbi:MAG: 30S ribosomal protein S8 [Candidatus Moranbacteria bacterium]|nr:30S ribosomal protein S8 [Candidatus Moranbacteria bacterium]